VCPDEPQKRPTGLAQSLSTHLRHLSPEIPPIPDEKASKQTQDLAQIPLTLNCLPSILRLQKARSYQTPYKGKFLSDPQEIPCIFG